MNNILNTVMKWKWFILFGLCVLIVLYVVSRVSFVEVTIPGNIANNTVFVYSLSKEGGNKVETFESSQPILSRRVQPGRYEVLVTTDSSGSMFSVVETSGFFKKTHLRKNLVAESPRLFVGDNPLACMLYTNKILVSHECGGSYATASLHLPASQNSPTFAQKNTSSNDFLVIDKVFVKNRYIVLGRNVDGRDGRALRPYSLYEIGEGGDHISSRSLDLNGNKNYKFAGGSSGFIIYDVGVSEAHYFESYEASPKTVAIPNAERLDSLPYVLDTSENMVLIGFSNKVDFQEKSDPSQIGKTYAEIHIRSLDGSDKRIFKTDKHYINVMFCGKYKICALTSSGSRLEFFDVSGTDLSYLGSVSGVLSMKQFGDYVLAVRENHILKLGPNSSSGHIDYSFGKYRFCGIEVLESSYVVCVVDPSGNSRALLVGGVNNDIKSTGFIDRHLIGLQNIESIKRVSVYGYNVYITPELGAPIYNSMIESFDYNPIRKNEVKFEINKALDELGVDKSKYIIYLSGVN